MPSRSLHAALTSGVLSLFVLTAHAAAPTARDAAIDESLVQLKAQYVFPDKFDAIERHVRKHQQAGDYANAASDKAFADLLTTHLQEISHDKHMSLSWQKDARASRPRQYEVSAAAQDKERRANYGLRKVEVLPGNIGYMDIAFFHNDAQVAGDTYAGAMSFLANTDALIIDLRNNRGGGNTNQLLASYFFDSPTLLTELRYRGQAPMQFWSQPYVPGKRYGSKPVFVLTSGRTFSAAEAFAFAMQNNKRATLVGATTRGGGNPNTHVPIGSDYVVSIPIGQAVDPETGKGWEGVGVTPEIVVDEQNALAAAQRKALESLRDTAKEEAVRDAATKALAGLAKG